MLGEEGRYGEWERDGIVPREVFALAGRGGFLGMAVPERYGGAGAEDFRFNLVIGEETQRAGVGGFGLGITLHNDICLPYFLTYCNDAQRERWLAGIASGELITALAMTEPGSAPTSRHVHARAARGRALRRRRHEDVHHERDQRRPRVVAVKTDPSSATAASACSSLERGMEGFERGRNLEKIGQHAQDTAELSFADVHVPVENLLGEEGEGFRYLVSNLPQERLSIAASAVAAAEAALGWTLDYVRERQAFGQPIGSFQNSRFVLAEVRTETEIARTYVDRCAEALNDG